MTQKYHNLFRLPGWSALGFALICWSVSVSAQTSSDTAKEAQRLTRVAQVAQQEGRYDDALKAYKTIAVIAVKESRVAAVAHLNIGNIYMARANYEAAAAAFERSVKLDGNSAEAYNNLGEALG